jgi:hypothetical protein
LDEAFVDAASKLFFSIPKQHLIKVCTVSQGTVNESLGHPREIFKPVITHSAYSFIMRITTRAAIPSCTSPMA